MRLKSCSPTALLLVFSLFWRARPAQVCTATTDEEDSCKAQTNGDSPEETLVQWIQSLEGGIVNTDIFEIQRTMDDGGYVEYDMVATKDIPRGQVLMEIPQQAIIGKILSHLQESALENLAVDPTIKEHIPTCMAIEKIVNERQKGTKSQHYPYLEFVFGHSPKQQKPSEWSQKAQSIFWDMIGSSNTVYTPDEEHFKIYHPDICQHYKQVSPRSKPPTALSPEDAAAWKSHRASIEEAAYSYFTKHAWGTSLIPLLDMIPHRNGKWRNVEATFVEIKSHKPVILKPRNTRFDEFKRQNSTQNLYKVKLVVYADRNIVEGEPLRVSLNQCKHLGCEYLKLNYTTSDLLADTGILEDYPRVWSIQVDHLLGEDSTRNFVLEVNLDASEEHEEFPKKTVRVLQTNKDMDEIYKHVLFDASIERWRALEDKLKELMEDWKVQTARDKHEYNTIQSYRKGYTEAFELAWIHRHDQVNRFDKVHNTTQNTIQGYYDDLSTPKGPAMHTKGGYMACAEGEVMDEGRLVGQVHGFYQNLEYFYEADADNTYMKMATWLHSGSNFRAHYHESVIHVALQYVETPKRFAYLDAENTYVKGEIWLHSGSNFRAHYHEGLIHEDLQYVETPKRVAYIGGGDNMVLAELLKYKSIEKIVGMELDQQVCRSSMKHFGTTPAYHDDRVEWWYGNGALSLQLLPEDYFGSFDLVLVDLLTDVADAVKVKAGLSISETAVLLMKPDGGVLARNDDYVNRAEVSQKLAQRVVMFDFFDAPRLCEVSASIASNSIDFVNGPRYNHGIETLTRLTNFEKDRYTGWARYYDSTNTSLSDDSNSGTRDAVVCKKIQHALQEKDIRPVSSGGILLIIEAENVTKSLEPQNLPNLHESIKNIAKEHGLSPMATSHEPKKDIHAFVLLCEKGYIKMQTYPQFQYVAFDLALWGGSSFVDKSKDIERDLVASVGGGTIEGSVSDYRIVTGGMTESEESSESNNGLVEKALNYYCADESSNIDGEAKGANSKLDSENDKTSTMVFGEHTILPEVLFGITAQKTSLVGEKTFFVIFCGKKDDENCRSYSSNSFSDEKLFHPVYSCESFEDMPGCESEIIQNLQNVILEHKRLDGFVLDRSMSLDMGKIIHKVFNNTLHQSQILERSFLGVAPGGEGSWRNVLLDRFRTEIVMAPPVQKADLEVSNGTHSDAWAIVSVQNHKFLDDLHIALDTIQRKSGWSITVRKILDSIIPLHTDWDPDSPTDEDFFREEVMDQWFGQEPVANQYVLQMELGSKPAPVNVDEVVLVGKEFMTDGVMADLRGFLFEYYEATIIEVRGRKNELYVAEIKPYQLIDGQTVQFQHRYLNNSTKTISRYQIRKISPTENERNFNVGDLVLVKQRHPITKEVIPMAWFAATIVSMTENGFSVRAKNGEEEQDLANISSEDIMVYSESPEFMIRNNAVSLEDLEFAFEQSTHKAGLAKNGAHFKTFKLGNGYIVIFLSPKGSGIMKWNGADRVEVNMLVTEGEFEENFDAEIRLFGKAFLKNLPSLKLIAKDSFPRGYGKVVNFKHEMVQIDDDDTVSDYIPMWMIDHVPASMQVNSLEFYYIDKDKVK